VSVFRRSGRARENGRLADLGQDYAEGHIGYVYNARLPRRVTPLVIEFEPMESGSGFEFGNRIGNKRDPFRRKIERGHCNLIDVEDIA